MVGWILTVGLGTLPLLSPAAAVPTALLSSLIPLAIALALCLGRAAAATAAAGARADGVSSGGDAAAAVAVPPATALHFVLLAVVLGTNAEVGLPC
eukprot:7368071-Prymnesium_polylepis.1